MCPKTVRNAYQALALRERFLPSAKYSKSRSYVNASAKPPHLLLERAQTWSGVQHPVFASATLFTFSWHSRWSRFWISFWSLQWVFSRNACRMREQLCKIDNPDPVTRMPSQRSLVSVFPTSHPLDALLSTSSRPWPMPCVSTRPSQSFTSTTTRLVMRESRPRGGSGRSLEDHREHRDSMAPICSRDGFATLNRYENSRYDRPSATQRLIMFDSLEISFSLCRFLRQQSSALTGFCCRPWNQQDHQRCWVVRWPAHRWRRAGLVAGDERRWTWIGWSLLVPDSLDWHPRVLASTSQTLGTTSCIFNLQSILSSR